MIGRELKEALTPLLKGEEPAYASALLAGLLRVYGLPLLEWDGLTIQMELRDDFGIDPPRRVYDQIMAAITALQTDAVYQDVGAFDQTISSFRRHGVTRQKDPPTVADVALTVAELQLLDPEPVGREGDKRWGRDVRKYVRAILDSDGMEIAPRILNFAPSRPAKAQGMDQPAIFAGTWGSKQAQADEIDEWVEQQVVQLLRQMLDLGVEFPEPKEKPRSNNPALLDELEERLPR